MCDIYVCLSVSASVSNFLAVCACVYGVYVCACVTACHSTSVGVRTFLPHLVWQAFTH